MAEKSLLTIVKDFCKRAGLQEPSVAAGAADDTTVQIVNLLNEGIQEICDRYALQQLTMQKTFTHENGADYQALDLAVNVDGWKYMEPFTIWDTGTRLALTGPLTIQEWARSITMQIAPATYSYIVFQNKLRIYPVPSDPTAVTFTFFYQTKNGVEDGGTGYDSYVTDTSTPRVPTYLVEADLKWRWARQKGLPYAEDFRTCESMLMNAVGREPKAALSLDYGDHYYGPGIFVSPGSWPL